MSEQPNGLRFDIYERVHLADDVPAIRDLDEIELVPHIQVVEQGDQALLRGHLQLTGAYASETEGEGTEKRSLGARLEHYIPVEITLPMNRIHSLDEIAVEIENFDVELLSARSLNVTGVLSLHGIRMATPVAAEWQEEDVVFTHRAEERFEPVQPVQAAPTAPTAAQPAAPPVYPSVAPMVSAEAAPKKEPSVSPFAVPDVTPVEPHLGPFVSLYESSDVSSYNVPDVAPLGAYSANPFAPSQVSPSEAANVAPDMMPNVAPSVEANVAPAVAFNVRPESANVPVEEAAFAKEPKVAFAPKTDAAESAAAPHGGLGALLQKAPGKSAEAPAAVQPAVKGVSEAEYVKDKLEWRSLFLRGNEEQSFRKLRLCIVQKEETIDSIAEKYRLSTKQIVLYNRLSEQNVREGQILYIPIPG